MMVPPFSRMKVETLVRYPMKKIRYPMMVPPFGRMKVETLVRYPMKILFCCYPKRWWFRFNIRWRCHLFAEWRCDSVCDNDATFWSNEDVALLRYVDLFIGGDFDSICDENATFFLNEDAIRYAMKMPPLGRMKMLLCYGMLLWSKQKVVISFVLQWRCRYSNQTRPSFSFIFQRFKSIT